MKSPFQVPLLIAFVFAGVGFFPLPYGFYMLLKLAFFVIAIYGAVLLYQKKDPAMWGLVGIAILFNPLIPIHLGNRVLWILADIVALGMFYWVHHKLSKVSG